MRHATGASLVMACLMWPFGTHASESWPDCLRAAPVALQVRIGDAPAVSAWLEGGIETPLRVRDALTGRILWSASTRASSSQVFEAMDTAFMGSYTAVDLDSDGLHDRIYAGDMAARLWRFDLHHGAAPDGWTSGGIFADFSNPEGRSFIAAPDVSLSAPPDAAPSLTIAVGTAAPGNPAAHNRFYVLRDHAVYDSWSDQDYAAWQPVREADLQRVDTFQGGGDTPAFADPADPGWFIELGGGHVVTPSLTVSHRAVLAIAAPLPNAGGPCEVFVRIATLDLQHQRVVPVPEEGEWRLPLIEPVPALASLSVGAAQGNVAPCTLAGQRVAACDVDTRPRRTWWRRGDAD